MKKAQGGRDGEQQPQREEKRRVDAFVQQAADFLLQKCGGGERRGKRRGSCAPVVSCWEQIQWIVLRDGCESTPVSQTGPDFGLLLLVRRRRGRGGILL